MVTTPDNSLFLGQTGPLTGVLMLHVNFKKCQCCMSLSFNISLVPYFIRNANVPCQYIILANVAVAKDHVAL